MAYPNDAPPPYPVRKVATIKPGSCAANQKQAKHQTSGFQMKPLGLEKHGEVGNMRKHYETAGGIRG